MFGGVFKKPKSLFARSQSRVGAASPRCQGAVCIVVVSEFGPLSPPGSVVHQCLLSLLQEDLTSDLSVSSDNLSEGISKVTQILVTQKWYIVL